MPCLGTTATWFGPAGCKLITTVEARLSGSVDTRPRVRPLWSTPWKATYAVLPAASSAIPFGWLPGGKLSVARMYGVGQTPGTAVGIAPTVGVAVGVGDGVAVAVGVGGTGALERWWTKTPDGVVT